MEVSRNRWNERGSEAADQRNDQAHANQHRSERPFAYRRHSGYVTDPVLRDSTKRPVNSRMLRRMTAAYRQGDPEELPARRLRTGVDIGGTFTDIFVFDDTTGEMRTTKTWSTPDDPLAMLAAFDDIAVDCAELAVFAHASTVGVNAVLTRTGSPTGLLCTRGHRDVLDMGRGLRRAEQIWDFTSIRPHQARPIVPREWRRSITERTIYDGSVLIPIDADEVIRETSWLVAKGAESIAVAYINSYLNPENERRTRELIRSAFPRLPVFTSTDIFPTFREVYRTTSVVINAYISPIVDRYIGRLEDELAARSFRGEFTVMKVDGGFATPAGLRDRGIETLHSGPVAGVSAARFLGQEIALENLMLLDMGGTTTDVSLVSADRTDVVTDFEIEQDLFLGIPVVDVTSIGTGGGSIAWVDPAGGLRVGPASAGSRPGPACYGRGGEEPTVTDAHVVRGTLPADHFLGGAARLDVGRARDALLRVSGPLGIPIEEAAQGVIDIAEVNMAGALRSISIFRGKDPRDYALLAFGAAGPMHGPALGRELGVAETIIPPWPGEFSAFGLLASDYRSEMAQPLMARLDELDPGRLSGVLEGLEREVTAALATQGVSPDSVVVTRMMDAAYTGQSWDTACVLPGGRFRSAADIDSVHATWEESYERTWGSRLGMPIRVSAVRVAAVGLSPKPTLRRLAEGSEAPPAAALLGATTATLRDGGRLARREVPVYERAALLAGNAIGGPAVIVQATSTTILYGGDLARVDAIGNLRVRGS